MKLRAGVSPFVRHVYDETGVKPDTLAMIRDRIRMGALHRLHMRYLHASVPVEQVAREAAGSFSALIAKAAINGAQAFIQARPEYPHCPRLSDFKVAGAAAENAIAHVFVPAIGWDAMELVAVQLRRKVPKLREHYGPLWILRTEEERDYYKSCLINVFETEILKPALCCDDWQGMERVYSTWRAKHGRQPLSDAALQIFELEIVRIWREAELPNLLGEDYRPPHCFSTTDLPDD